MKKVAYTKPTILWEDRKRTLFGLPLSFTKYSLSEDRLFIEEGFLNKREDEVRLYRIMDISVKRSLGQRIFGVGRIHCCSSDKSKEDFDMIVKDVHAVKETLSKLVETEREKKHVYSREYLDHDVDDGDDE